MTATEARWLGAITSAAVIILGTLRLVYFNVWLVALLYTLLRWTVSCIDSLSMRKFLYI